MGRAKQKKEAFIAKHPFCCFCGGAEPSVTIDHIPARACFVGRAFPEEFEFPACAKCQNASRHDENFFSFCVRFSDFSRPNLTTEEMDKLISGLKNNLPHLIPVPSSHQTRTAGMGSVDIHPEGEQRILRYGRKLACALYYREQQRAAPLTHRIFSFWGQTSNLFDHQRFEAFVKMTPLVTIGQRSNLDFGDQFGYRCNKKANDPDVVAAICQFGKGIIIASIVIEPRAAELIGFTDVQSVAVSQVYEDSSF